MTDTNLVTISRLDIYDLLHNQAVKMDKEKEFLDQFGTRDEFRKKHGLNDEKNVELNKC